MANLNAPFGFIPLRHVTGYGHSTNRYTVASELAENIAAGDVVKMTGTDRNVILATAGDAIIGVVLGFEYTLPDGSYVFSKVWKSGTAVKSGTKAYCLVHDDPMETFMVQTTGTIGEDDVGQLVDVSYATPDFALNKSKSGVSAGGSTESQFRVERILEVPQRQVDSNNNTVGYGLSGPGQYAVVEVKIAKHQRLGSALAVEV